MKIMKTLWALGLMLSTNIQGLMQSSNEDVLSKDDIIELSDNKEEGDDVFDVLESVDESNLLNPDIEEDILEEDLIEEHNEDVKTEIDETIHDEELLKESSKIDFLHITDYPQLIEALEQAEDEDLIVLDKAFDLSTLSNKRMELKTPDVSVTLDGQGLNLEDNAMTISNGVGSLLLKNFTFDGGSQAIYVSSQGSIVFDNFMIRNRVGANGAAINIDGGGMSGTFTLKNSTLLNNVSNQSGYTGGGLYTDFFNGTMTLENNVFDGNKTLINGTVAGGQGGAVFIKRAGNESKIVIQNNYFKNNEANINNQENVGNPDLSDGGAVALFDIKAKADISVDSNTFYNNVAGADGGAMLVQFEESNTSTRIRNNTFFKNTALTNFNSSENSGGAIQLFQTGKMMSKSYVEISNNTFVNNRAGTRGGAIGTSGAVLRFVYSRLINNIFVDNTAAVDGYNNFSGQIDLDKNNLGVDAGNENEVSSDEVFGTKGLTLSSNKSSVFAGSLDSRVVLETLPILPKGLADNKEIEPVNAYDQRSYYRNLLEADLGSTDIKFIEIDANSGEWTDTAQEFYDGLFYHESKNDNYFIIGHQKEALSLDVSSILSRDNYTLEGFNTEADGSGTQYSVYEMINNDRDLKVYAMWTKNEENLVYSITYDGNGHDQGEVPLDLNEYQGSQNAIIKNQGSLSKQGYSFKGWTKNSDGSGVYYQENDVLIINEDTVLYAQWIKNEELYTVRYDGNGHTSGNVPTDTHEYHFDEKAIILNHGNLEKSEYKFVGWNTMKDGTGLSYKDKTEVLMKDNLILYAQWSKDTGILSSNQSKYPVNTGISNNTKLYMILSVALLILGVQFKKNKK